MELIKVEERHLVAGLLVVEVTEVGEHLESLLNVLGLVVLHGLPAEADPLAALLVEGAYLSAGVCLDLLVDVLEAAHPDDDLPVGLEDKAEGSDSGLLVLVESRNEEAVALLDKLNSLCDAAHLWWV